MPFQRPPRPLSVLASALAVVGLGLAVAGCSHIPPLGPDPALVSLPSARDLGSPIMVQVMRSPPLQPASARPAQSRSSVWSPTCRGSCDSPRESRHREHRHPRPYGHANHADRASRASGGRSG